ncbi:MAG: hypothetical protein H0V17_00130 [Deltaproteobacteria bacterium]|nr:hypothetical protein [Deltaproteobacteria bacterium]
MRVVLMFLMLTSACGKKTPEEVPTPGSAETARPKRSALGAKGSGGEFTPSTKGFKFQNYGNEDGVENLTATELERMFGEQVCAERDGEECILTPAAERWMEQENEGMNGGHCEGMATVALLFQLGKLDPNSFGAKTAHELELADNRKLQHEIAYWFVTQSLDPFYTASMTKLTPVQVVDKLIEAFESNKESYTLGFFKPDMTGGHATTPYAVVDKGNDVSWIMHYDNNFPGEERYIEVDRKTNAWKYFTAANPKEEGENYVGDATTLTLGLSPTSVRLGKLQCGFCGDVDSADGASAKGMRRITAEGDADLLIVDESGKRIGNVGGKVVNEIAGADVIERKSYRNSDAEPIYAVPGGKKLTLTLDGSKLKAEQTADVSLFGPGYTMGVYDVELEPNAKDIITVSADWKEITYKTESDETPIVEIGISTSDADFEFEVHAAGETGGQMIRILLDPKAGTMTVEASAKDGGASYEVEIHRIDDHKEEVFKHKGMSSGPKDRIVFHYKDWKGNGDGMAADIDKDGDGDIDDTEDYTDEE